MEDDKTITAGILHWRLDIVHGCVASAKDLVVATVLFHIINHRILFNGSRDNNKQITLQKIQLMQWKHWYRVTDVQQIEIQPNQAE